MKLRQWRRNPHNLDLMCTFNGKLKDIWIHFFEKIPKIILKSTKLGTNTSNININYHFAQNYHQLIGFFSVVNQTIPKRMNLFVLVCKCTKCYFLNESKYFHEMYL